MRLRSDPRRWDAVTRTLHWLVAALILALFALGWLARLAPLTPGKISLFYWHKSLGLLVLALVLIRLGWRAGNRPPALPAGLAAWEPLVARATHVFLYFLIVLLPLSGWLIDSASGIPFQIFWRVPLPAIVPVSAGIEHLAEVVHLSASWALAVVLVGHIGAALRHHFVLHNTVLLRMLPFVKNPERER